MAMKSWGVEFEGLEELTRQIEEAGGKMEPVARRALKSTHRVVTGEIEKRIQPGNLPAKGRYSGKGGGASIQDALKKSAEIEVWGSILSVKTGFDVGKLPRKHIIYLINGTPKMRPVRGLKTAVRGTGKVKKLAQEIQKRKFEQAIREILG